MPLAAQAARRSRQMPDDGLLDQAREIAPGRATDRAGVTGTRTSVTGTRTSGCRAVLRPIPRRPSGAIPRARACPISPRQAGAERGCPIWRRAPGRRSTRNLTPVVGNVICVHNHIVGI